MTGLPTSSGIYLYLGILTSSEWQNSLSLTHPTLLCFLVSVCVCMCVCDVCLHAYLCVCVCSCKWLQVSVFHGTWRGQRTPTGVGPHLLLAWDTILVVFAQLTGPWASPSLEGIFPVCLLPHQRMMRFQKIVLLIYPYVGLRTYIIRTLPIELSSQPLIKYFLPLLTPLNF